MSRRWWIGVTLLALGIAVVLLGRPDVIDGTDLLGFALGIAGLAVLLRS